MCIYVVGDTMVSSDTLNSSVAAVLTRKKNIDQDDQAGWRSHLADTGTLGGQQEPILPDVWNQLPCHMDTMHTTAHNMGTLTIPVQV